MSIRKSVFLPVLVALFALATASATGTDKVKKKSTPSKKVAAKVLTQVLARDAKDHSWKPLTAKDPVKYGDLLVGGYGASLVNSKGTVRFTMLGDLLGKSPFPIIETAVSVNPATEEGLDLDLTFDRGRIDLVNIRKTGSARVRLHVQKETWDLVLSEPESRVALELYGRWPRGATFKKDAGPDYGPELHLIVLILKGQVDLKAGGTQFQLGAPPGPALIQWDSLNGWDKSPAPLETLPTWADQSSAVDSGAGKLQKLTLLQFRTQVRKQGLDATLDEFLNSEDPGQRRLAVYVLGATDNLKKIGAVLNKTTQPDVWDNAVLVLRHWIGRGPGQDQILYKMLVENKKISPTHAETILQLLHSFGDTELSRPETYEVLIEYLGHDVLGIRGLAHWHLSRLVPAGRKIAYSPHDPPAARARAQEEWRKLIPSGQLPPPANREQKGTP